MTTASSIVNIITFLLLSFVVCVEAVAVELDCKTSGNEVTVTSGLYGEDGLAVKLASGCKVSISNCQTTKLAFSGTTNSQTEILLNNVRFGDDTRQTVTTASYITNVGVTSASIGSAAGVKSIRILNCKVTRTVTDVQTAVTILFSSSSAINAEVLELSDNQMDLTGMKQSFIAGIFSSASQIRVTKIFAVHGNRVQLASATAHTAGATPAVFIMNIAGSFLTQIPVVNITSNEVRAPAVRADGFVPSIASFSGITFYGTGELLFSSNSIISAVYLTKEKTGVTGAMFALLSTDFKWFNKITFDFNALTLTLSMTGAATFVSAQTIRFGTSSRLKGIDGVAGGFYFKKNTISLTNDFGDSSVVTKANMVDVPSVLNTPLYITDNEVQVYSTSLGVSFTQFNLGNVSGSATILNVSENTIRCEGQLESNLAYYDFSMLRVDRFLTRISKFEFTSNNIFNTIPDSFSNVKVVMAVFPLYSYRLHPTTLGLNYWEYTYNGNNQEHSIFLIRDSFTLDQIEVTSTWGLLEYNTDDSIDEEYQKQKMLIPQGSNIQKSTKYDNAWIFDRTNYDAASDTTGLSSLLTSMSATVASASALATNGDQDTVPVVSLVQLRCNGVSPVQLKTKIGYTEADRATYPEIPTYKKTSNGDIILFKGTSSLCKIGVSVAREITTTTTSGTTTTSSTTTSSTTTSSTTTSTTPAPPTTSSTTTTTSTTSSTTSTTPAPPTTSSTTSTTSSTTSTTSSTTTTTSTTTSTTTTTTTLPPPTRTITMIPPTPAPTPVPVDKAVQTPLAAASVAVAAVPVVAMGVSRSAAVSNLLNSEDGCAGPGDGEELGFVDNPFAIVIESAGEDGKYMAGSVVGNIYISFAWLAAQTLLGYGWCWFRDGNIPGFIEVTGRCHVTVFLLLFIGLFMTPTITNAMTYAMRPTSKLGWSAFLLFSTIISQSACCYWAYYTIYLRKEVETFVIIKDDEDSDDEEEDFTGGDYQSAEAIDLEKVGSQSLTSEAEEELLREQLKQKAKIEAKKIIKKRKKDAAKAAKKPLGNHPKDLAIRFYRYWIRPFGDWYIPDDVDVDDYHAFESAAPAIDAHTKKGRFFTIPDIGLQVGLAFCPVIAELVGEGRESCFAMGLLLTINLFVYTGFLLWYSPMRSRLIEYVLVFVTMIQLITCIIATVSYASSPDWLDNAGIVITVAQTIQAIAGMMDWANRFLVPFIMRLYHKQWQKKRYALKFEDFLDNLNAHERDEQAVLAAEDQEAEKLLSENEELKKLDKIKEEQAEKERLEKMMLEKKLREEEEARAMLLGEPVEQQQQLPVRQEASVTFDQPRLPEQQQPRGLTDEEVLAWRRHELKQLKFAMNDLL